MVALSSLNSEKGMHRLGKQRGKCPLLGTFATLLSQTVLFSLAVRQISVIGSSVCDETEAKLAEEVGAEIAHSGAALICGGMGGVMEAASRGAKKARGTVVGILPGLKSTEGNSYTDISILTGMGDGRNIIVASSGDAVIAIGGEFGTLSEIGLALKNRRPVIGLSTWSLNVKDYCKGKDIVVAKTAKEAVSSALRLIK